MSEFLRLRKMFEAALELPESERASYVREACGDSAELRRDLLELLEIGEESLDYLEPPSAAELHRALSHQVALPELEGTSIEGFRLERILASGGMGVVFEALQGEPRRIVAIKVLRSGLDSPDAIRRFRFESELLGRLNHPAIARVFDAGVHELAASDGETRSLPWFAMELIEGGTDIASYVRKQELSRDERLSLAIRLCEAIHHAHLRGVVHRDLKPDNVLVDAAGNPKIIDFGVARDVADDSSLRTQTGQLVGTLRYMSPEQIQGRREDIDARTDVHALGILIFEVLCGQHPYVVEGTPPHEIARLVLETSPRKLRHVDPGFPRDLEIVLSKALEKDPSRRYQSAAAFGEDLERFRRGETILARPASLTYQARTFARRHRLLVLAAILVLVASITATVISTLAASEAKKAEAAAREEERRVSRLVERHLEASTRNIREFRERLSRMPGTTELGRDLMSTTRADLESLIGEVGNNRRILIALADALLQLGQAQAGQMGSNLGVIEEGLQCFRRARDVAVELRASPTDEQARRLIAKADLGTASILAAQGQVSEPVELYRRGIAELRDLSRDDLLSFDLGITAAQGALASIFFRTGRLEEAFEVVEARHAITSAALELASDDPDRLGNHGISLAQLGMTLYERGRLDEAEDLVRGAAESADRLCAVQPRDPRHRNVAAKHRFFLGEILMAQERFEEADQLTAEGIEGLKSLVQDDPESVAYARSLALAFGMRGGIALRESSTMEGLDERRIAAWKRAEENLALATEGLESLIESGRLPRGELATHLDRLHEDLEQVRSDLRQ